MRNQTNNDLAFPLMAMDILKNVLSHADNPGELGIYLTEELRELTDSRCTILVQRDHECNHCTHRIVCVTPERHFPLAQSPEMERFIGIVDELTEARLWQAEDISEGARVFIYEHGRHYRQVCKVSFCYVPDLF